MVVRSDFARNPNREGRKGGLKNAFVERDFLVENEHFCFKITFLYSRSYVYV